MKEIKLSNKDIEKIATFIENHSKKFDLKWKIKNKKLEKLKEGEMIIKKKDLLDTLKLTSKDSRKNTIPVLKTILLQVKDNNLNFQWTNLDTSVEVNKTVIGNGSYALCVPKKQLEESITNLEDENIKLDFNIEKMKLDVSDKDTIISIGNCLEKKEFPALPKKIEGESAKAQTLVLKKGIQTVSFAMATKNDYSRPQLQGVNIKFLEDKIEFAATDGKQMAVWNFPQANDQQFNLFLSSEEIKILLLLLKMYKESEIVLTKDKDYVQLILNDITETFLLENLKFPDYQTVIDTYQEKYNDIVLSKKQLLDSLKVISKIKTPSDLTFNNSQLIIKNKNEDNIIQRKLQFNSQENININIRLNHRCLYQAIRKVEGPEVKIKLKSEQEPIIVEENTYRYLLMPMKKDS